MEVQQALRDAISLIRAQFSLWTVDLSEHAVGLESHHASLYNANVAVGKLQNKILDMDKEIILLRNACVIASTLSKLSRFRYCTTRSSSYKHDARRT